MNSTQKRAVAHALTSTAVALALGFAPTAQGRFFYAYADAQTVEVLESQLVALSDRSKAIARRAQAERRDLTAEESAEVAIIFEQFEVVEARISNAQRPGRLSDPDVPDGTEPRTRAQHEASRTRASLPATPRDNRDNGRGGFRNSAEFYAAVVTGSRHGNAPDPRLIANAPTTYGQEGVGSDGGFAVPPDFRTEIVKRVMGEDSLLSMTDQMLTSSNSITVPTDETTPWQTSGGIQAYWESEAGHKQQSKPALTDKTVKANKIIALVPMTDELLQDAPGMASYVNSKAPDKIDARVNDAIVNGTGVGQPLGFLRSGALLTVAAEGGQSADTIVFDNVVSMYSRATETTKRRGVWLINGDAEPQLMKMQFPGTGTAVPAYLPAGGLSSTPYGTLLGRPVIPIEAASALGDVGDIAFVDLKQYMSVIKAGGIKQDVSIHLFFDYDITAFRFVLRVGGQPWWNTPVQRLNGLSRSPFIALAAR